MQFSLILVFITILITSVSQVLLKMGSRLRGDSKKELFNVYLNKYTLIAYVLFLLTTIISVIALRVVPLKLFYAIVSLNYIGVIILSWFLLKEEVSARMLVGIGLIVVGVVVFNY